ncbi:hypothetical protein Pelo_4991 [Pelomyxa schiedti]|nr:hypothetical protein Pelo_4991 [Pelomyxa schiedti]
MSVPSTTRTKPWWLGDVALRGGGLRERDQVMPLAVAADPRNRRGEHSPARIMGGHLLWLFWLNWILECTSVFEVQASVMKEDADCEHDNYEDGDDDYDEDEALVVVRIGLNYCGGYCSGVSK